MFRDGPVKGIVLLAMLGSSVLSAALSTAQTQAVAYAEECKNEESAEYKACVAAKEKEHKEKCDKVDRDIEQAQAKCRAEGSDNCDAIGALGHCAYPLFGFSCSVEQCTEFVRSGRYARGDSEERSRAQAVVENVVQTAADAVAPLGPTTVEAVGKFAATFPKLFRDQLMKQIDLARLDEVSDDKTGWERVNTFWQGSVYDTVGALESGDYDLDGDGKPDAHYDRATNQWRPPK